jgi:hypothetical protein
MARMQRMRGNILQAAVRSSVLSGAALLTAGAIAIAPLQPLPNMPTIQSIGHTASTAAVQLTSNAFDLYGEVIQTTIANLQADGQQYLTNGWLPIIRQILGNQVSAATGLIGALGDSGRAFVTALTQQAPSYVGAAVSDLGKFNVEGALNNLQLAIVLPIFAAINPLGTLPTAIAAAVTQPLQSLINVANDLPNILLEAGLGLVGPIAGGLGAAGAAVQNVINAVKAGDLGKLITAVIQAPATLLNGVLNGGYGPNLGALLGINIPGYTIFGGGLFGGGATVPGGATISGTVQALIAIGQSILRDITPKAKTAAAAAAITAAPAAGTTTNAVSALPAASATTVTLSTAATTKATKTTKTKDDSTTKAGTSTDDSTTGSTGEGTKDTRSGHTGRHGESGTSDSASGSSSASDSSAAGSASSDTGSSHTGAGSTGTHSGSKGTHAGSKGNHSGSGSGSKSKPKSHHHAA